MTFISIRAIDPDIRSGNSAYVNNNDFAKLTHILRINNQLRDHLLFGIINGKGITIEPHASVKQNELHINLRLSSYLNLELNSKTSIMPYKDNIANVTAATIAINQDLLTNCSSTNFVEVIAHVVKQVTVKTVVCSDLSYNVRISNHNVRFKIPSMQFDSIESRSKYGYITDHTTFNVTVYNQKDALLRMNNSEKPYASANNYGMTATNNKQMTDVNPEFIMPSKTPINLDFDFLSLGIGGLSAQFEEFFRRAFSSRICAPELVEKLGITHVKGVLLYGPPGTGKTLIARQIGKALGAREPKVVNGPELLDKYVGQSEANLRILFEDAEAEEKQLGLRSSLHIIIFDEFDAICKQRGSTNNSVNDSLVNQLLSKIDGVDALNNILLIAMTNRKDLIDSAVLRPGRIEVHIEIGLPDEAGRQEILNIHTAKLSSKSRLASDVNLSVLAHRTKNFSGAELAGLVRNAVSFAIMRCKEPNVDISNQEKYLDKNLMLTMQDFEQALSECRPTFGNTSEEISLYAKNGIIHYSSEVSQFEEELIALSRQLDDKPSLLSCLLIGQPGSGKTSFSLYIANLLGYPFVRTIQARDFISMFEQVKMAMIAQTFDDAFKSMKSVVVIDDIESILDFTPIGPRFSNIVLQGLIALLKTQCPQNHSLIILGTTANENFLKKSGLYSSFSLRFRIPKLNTVDALMKCCHNYIKDNKLQVKELKEFFNTLLSNKNIDSISIKKLYITLDMCLSKFGNNPSANDLAVCALACSLNEADSYIDDNYDF